MKVLLCGHFHCAKCGSHLGEQNVRMEPPDVRDRVFWCENPKCPNYKVSFVAVAREVEVERVDLHIEQSAAAPN